MGIEKYRKRHVNRRVIRKHQWTKLKKDEDEYVQEYTDTHDKQE